MAAGTSTFVLDAPLTADELLLRLSVVAAPPFDVGRMGSGVVIKAPHTAMNGFPRELVIAFADGPAGRVMYCHYRFRAPARYLLILFVACLTTGLVVAIAQFALISATAETGAERSDAAIKLLISLAFGGCYFLAVWLLARLFRLAGRGQERQLREILERSIRGGGGALAPKA